MNGAVIIGSHKLFFHTDACILQFENDQYVVIHTPGMERYLVWTLTVPGTPHVRVTGRDSRMCSQPPAVSESISLMVCPDCCTDHQEYFGDCPWTVGDKQGRPPRIL